MSDVLLQLRFVRFTRVSGICVSDVFEQSRPLRFIRVSGNFDTFVLRK